MKVILIPNNEVINIHFELKQVGGYLSCMPVLHLNFNFFHASSDFCHLLITLQTVLSQIGTERIDQYKERGND